MVSSVRIRTARRGTSALEPRILLLLLGSLMSCKESSGALAFAPHHTPWGKTKVGGLEPAPPIEQWGKTGAAHRIGEPHVRAACRRPFAIRAIQEDATASDWPVQPKYPEAPSGMVSCLVRYVADGGKIVRDGRIIRFNLPANEARAFSGASLLAMLQKEQLDLKAFKPLVYDQLNGGWAKLEDGLSFDFEGTPSRKIDIKLQPSWDKAVSRPQDVADEGYFSIGVLGLRHGENLGTLWRSAYQLGASQIFMVGGKFDKLSSDVVRAWTNIPLVEHENWMEFSKSLPYSAQLVAVEMGGEPLATFEHPKRAVYVLGSEDNGIPESMLRMCHARVTLPCVRYESFNVAVAGSVLMYDRLTKMGMDPKAMEKADGE